MSVKSALRKMGRAFRAKDEAAFDDAIEELEEGLDKGKGRDEEEPETIEVHNHIPDGFSRDTSIGEVPPKEGSEKTFDEAPPWFEEHKKATDAFMKKMSDDIAALSRDRRGRDEEIIEDPDDPELDAEEENLEMTDRGRRNQDEPAERQEMAERIKEKEKERPNNDEANKEILGELEFEAPPGTGDRARKARDSRYLEEAFQEAVSKAELLAPGIRLPTFDKAASPTRTAKAIFALRRTALDLAYNKPETRGVIDSAMSGRALDTKRMKPSHARVLFSTVAGVIGSDNNRRATDRSTGQGAQRHDAPAGLQSVADINKRNREHYAARH
jgi:hypothetical protein